METDWQTYVCTWTQDSVPRLSLLLLRLLLPGGRSVCFREKTKQKELGSLITILYAAPNKRWRSKGGKNGETGHIMSRRIRVGVSYVMLAQNVTDKSKAKHLAGQMKAGSSCHDILMNDINVVNLLERVIRCSARKRQLLTVCPMLGSPLRIIRLSEWSHSPV